MNESYETESGDIAPLLKFAFEAAPLGLVVARNRIISLYNTSFSDMFGYGERELVNSSLDCLYPSLNEFEATGDRATQTMVETGVYNDERIMRTKKGKLFWCRVTGRARDKSVPLQVAVWTFEDISVRRPVASELTPREREISQLLVLGKTSKIIAKNLGISPRTVEAHRMRLMRKLSAATGTELIARLIGRDIT